MGEWCAVWRLRAKVRFKYHQKSGANIQPISAHTIEKEVLLPAEAQYLVIERTEQGGTTYITLKEVKP